MYNTVIALMVRDIMALNGIFSIFPLAGLIKVLYKCFTGQEFYSLFKFQGMVASELRMCQGEWSYNFVLENPIGVLRCRMF